MQQLQWMLVPQCHSEWVEHKQSEKWSGAGQNFGAVEQSSE